MNARADAPRGNVHADGAGVYPDDPRPDADGARRRAEGETPHAECRTARADGWPPHVDPVGPNVDGAPPQAGCAGARAHGASAAFSGAAPADVEQARDRRVSVVVLTHNRAAEVTGTLERLARLPERPRLVVVDNGSSDGTAARIERRFADVEIVRLDANVGAAGRNAGVARVRTPYVAFCDDDTWWAPGALRRAADLLDAHPRIGAIAARVLVGETLKEDPACGDMANSPLEDSGLPGPALLSFMAGAVVMRVQAFREAGGYEPRLFLGAEEWLMGLDLAALGWQMVYAHEVVAHHHPSPSRDPRARRIAHARNLLWIAWMRLSAFAAWRETRRVLRSAAADRVLAPVVLEALCGLPWALSRRRVLPRSVHRMHELVMASRAAR
jgi:GT2 family glycosyltransferase